MSLNFESQEGRTLIAGRKATPRPYYPDVEVQLTGRSSNAGAIMSAVSQALRDEGVSSGEIATFREECLRGTYDDLLRTVQDWVEVY